MTKTEVSFKGFENAGELLDAVESLINDAKALAVGQKLTGYEVSIDVRFDAADSEDALSMASLEEETLTDGSKVYNILLS